MEKNEENKVLYSWPAISGPWGKGRLPAGGYHYDSDRTDWNSTYLSGTCDKKIIVGL